MDLDKDLTVHVVVRYFLRSLMKSERERLGLSRRRASSLAGWPSSAWAEIERQARPMQPQHWADASQMLELDNDKLVRRLNSFLERHPSIWLERMATGEIRIMEKAITSPRTLRSGRVVNVEIDGLRPYLYDELSTFADAPAEVIKKASELGMLEPREKVAHSKPSSPSAFSFDGDIDARKERMITAIMSMSEKKLGLLDRVLDKFKRFPAADLARAYEHFSLAVKKR